MIDFFVEDIFFVGTNHVFALERLAKQGYAHILSLFSLSPIFLDFPHAERLSAISNSTHLVRNLERHLYFDALKL
jgi:hypothetical protein